jgi:hypothetical protein
MLWRMPSLLTCRMAGLSAAKENALIANSDDARME